MKVVLLLFILGFATTIDAHFDPSSLVTQVLPNGDASYYVKKSTTTATACCDKCYCTKSRPPQCHCADLNKTCNSACKLCACLPSPPVLCRCVDITNFCYPPCN
ncbi:putative proteinase inhibitor I12, Bowman-Birk [Medicago truncatula]|uniref:Bowman birk trypsin inhibitor n=1 Tax=Medicago truncatula TaxID=3880 RepID=G7L4L4_MEDTR|nr:Bowman birk trypsin inhibitor [Medicago truncatula]RHN46937.1 putative proteinase inhibitor I12, Bowman-Birk [Medicago truncatula]